MVQINGKAQYTQGKELDSFMSGGDFLTPGEYTVKVKDIETDKIQKNNYITIVFVNNEGKEYKHNQFLPPFNHDFQEERYIELLARLGINLNTQAGDLSFNTDALINKACTIVLKRKWNDDHEKYFTELSYNKTWKKDDTVINTPHPMTEEEKAKAGYGGNNGGGGQGYGQAETNPFENAGAGQGPTGSADINDDDLPF